ncbi:MAG: mechanosensitive ion channel family protein [Chlorobi bacterium]|nr:mechanosensitive ion channel family protein [Chlorobiota bacterium]
MNPLLVAALLLVGGVIGWQVLVAMSRALQRREHRLLPRLLRVIGRAVLLVTVLGAGLVLLPMLGMSQRWQETVGIVGGTLVAAVVVARLLRELLQSGLHRERASPLAASLLHNIVYVGVYTIAIAVILAALGVNITAMVAAIGASGLIIGLALQETLANFFAGLYILLTGKVKVGDYVQFDTFEGTVEDVTWRTTLIRRANNAELIVPNQRLSTSVLTVFRAEVSPVMVRLEFLLEPSTDLEHAERVVLDAIGALLSADRAEGLCAEPFPVVRFGETTARGVQMFVWIAAQGVQHLFAVRSHTMRATVHALVQSGIQLVVLRQ